MSSDNGKPGEVWLASGERALARGDSEAAFTLLDRARQAGVDPGGIHRLASALGAAARFQGRHADVLSWIEDALEQAEAGAQRATFLAARIAVCRQIDVARVLQLAQEALDAADEVGDEGAYASILSHVAFAAYRTGDKRAATRYAGVARARAFQSKSARYDALRAQMFAATSHGKPEEALRICRDARDLAIEVDRRADAGNESNNVAETLLELGYPEDARDEATVAAELARESGHTQVESFAHVLMAVATAECGNLDPALDMLARIDGNSTNKIFAMDTAASEAFWLLERGAAGDAERARDVAQRAIDDTETTGVSNRLTMLYCQVARSLARGGRLADARAALEQARQLLDKSEPQAELQLALAFTEVLPVPDARRRTALANARSRILRRAALREDPRAFCIHVRVHRRLLELSGGVPADMLSG